MKSKNLFLVLFIAFGAFAANAQTSDAEAEAIINLLGVQKKEAMAQLVSVSGKDSIAFWKLYDDYQKENKALAQTRLKLYEKTARAYGNMTPARADSLATQYFNNRAIQEKSLQDFYKKIQSATNAVIAFEFYQAETYMLTQIRASIMHQIPTYGQLKNAEKKR